MFTLQVSGAPPPQGTCFPPTYPAFVADLASRLSVEGLEELSTFSFGPNVPSANMQGSPWFKTTSQGAPLNWYTFDGEWTPIPSPILAGTVVDFFGASGSIVVPWYIANGQTVTGPINGSLTTPNLQGLVTLGTGTNPTTGTNFPQGSTGGEEKHTPVLAEMFPHSHGTLSGGGFDTNAPGPSGAFVGGNNTTIDATTGSTGGGSPFNVLQPYMALFKIIYWP